MYLDPQFKTLDEQRKFLLVARKKCDNSFLYFCRFFFKAVEGKKFILNKHHYDLERHFMDVANYNVKLLNINIPPRCSKTEMLIFFICWGLGMRHTSNWLMVTGGDKLRKNAAIKIRRIITHPFFRIMYGLELAKDQNNVDVLRTIAGGGVVTASIGGTITGFGAGEITEENTSINQDTLKLIREFEGCQCWDDLNKMNDSASENANNQKVTDIVFDTLMSRENSVDTPIIHIQQRAGLSDVTAVLMEHYKYNEKTKECPNKKHRFVIMPIIYEDGTLLWEAKYPLSKVNELKTSTKTAHIFETQYMQNPLVAEGAMFNPKELNSFELSDLDLNSSQLNLGAIDVADTGIDYLSFPIGYLYNDKIYIVDWLFTQKDRDYTTPKTGQLIKDYKVHYTAIETNNRGLDFSKDVKKEVASTQIIDVISTGNKHYRIVQKESFIKKHFVFRSDVEVNSDYDLAMKQLYRYMKDKKQNTNKPDDAPDSLALLSSLAQDLVGSNFM